MTPELLAALTSHTPALAVGAVLCLFVLSAKLPSFAAQWERLPAWTRPLVPALLAIVGGTGEALIQGQRWWMALLVQVVAALPAIGYALPSPVVRTGTESVTVPAPIVVPPKPMTADELVDAVVKSLDGIPPAPKVPTIIRDTTPEDTTHAE